MTSNRARYDRDPSWGLYVYRTRFDDQELLDRYMNYIHDALASRVRCCDILRDEFHQWIAIGAVDKDWGYIGMYVTLFTQPKRHCHSRYRHELLELQTIDTQYSLELIALKNEAVDYLEEEVPLMIVETQPRYSIDEADMDWGDPTEDDADKEWQFVKVPFDFINLTAPHE
ncbi:hypothetical protein F5Y18DRAFT_432938 [Xylariaceae sp. FL1019]|nr:hypothetical protein F5Y18DRAFT_432938 [Xylariaceae sp. FL1019]